MGEGSATPGWRNDEFSYNHPDTGRAAEGRSIGYVRDKSKNKPASDPQVDRKGQPYYTRGDAAHPTRVMEGRVRATRHSTPKLVRMGKHDSTPTRATIKAIQAAANPSSSALAPPGYPAPCLAFWLSLMRMRADKSAVCAINRHLRVAG